MKQITFGIYEVNDLYRILDYAKEKKIEDSKNGKIYPKLLELELQTINTLKNRLNGIKPKEDYLEQCKAFREANTTRKKDDLPKAEYINY